MNRIIFLFLFSFFVSCSSTDIKDDAFPLLKSFSVCIDGEWIDAAINADKGQIDLLSIAEYDKITEVKYELSENSSILPLPESMIGKWNKDNNFLVYCGKNKKVYVLNFGSEPDYGVTNLPDPGELVGVHWKTFTSVEKDNGGKIISATVSAKPEGLTDYEKVEYYANTGANCIALKLEDGGQLCMDLVDENTPEADVEKVGRKIWDALEVHEQSILQNACYQGCASFIEAVNKWNIEHPDKSIYVMLFKRTWFQRQGKKIDGNMEKIASDFASIINICKRGGYDSPIIGVHAVENRINNIDELIPYCLDFADVINDKTKNWLKNKVYFFGGLGMGISFKGYDASKNVKGIEEAEGNETFWSKIKSKCAGFTWVYKRYPKYDNEPLLNEYMNEYSNTYSDTKEKMLKLYGHESLKKFVDTCPDEMYNNVLFWGDASDGMRGMSSAEIDALKAVWSEYNYKSGLFYHFFSKTAAKDADDKKDNIMWLDDGELSKNPAYDDWVGFFNSNTFSIPSEL